MAAQRAWWVHGVRGRGGGFASTSCLHASVWTARDGCFLADLADLADARDTLQVLDRVLARAGGQRWWAALSGRVKAQRAYNRAKAGEGRKVRVLAGWGGVGPRWGRRLCSVCC